MYCGDIMSKFSNRLRRLRERKELLSKDLAKIMDVEPATITIGGEI